jgi:glycosyltransferase
MKISIVVCSKNSEETIRDTLDSIHKQTQKNLEIVLVDGNSKDKTIKIFRSYQFKKKKIIKNVKGIYKSMNMGIKEASGDIIFVLNSDDKFYDKNVISSYLKLFYKTNCDLIYGKIKIYDKSFLKKIRSWTPPSKIKYSNLIKGILPPHPSFVVKKKIYNRFGTFNLNYKISSDFELILRFLKNKKIKKKFLNKFTVKMRHGGASSSSIYALFLRNIENLKILNYYFDTNWFKGFIYLLSRFIYKAKQYIQ